MSANEVRVTLSGVRLKHPATTGAPWTVVYGVASPLQVSPTEVALIVNRRVTGMPVVDFEDGADAVLFDSLGSLTAERATPLARTEECVHPGTGERLNMVAYLCTGGFVPLGARLADGSPHPAAGTGFGLATYLGCPLENEARLTPRADLHGYQELIQLRYDGRTLNVTGRKRFSGQDLLAGHQILVHAVNNAIPDGPDLVSGLVVGPVTKEGTSDGVCIPTQHPHGHARFGRNFGAGFCRWQFGNGEWRPVAIVPVSGPDLAFEPSLIRDRDGALLMSVRGKGLREPPGAVHDGLENTYEHFRVYRSTDAGLTWQRAVHLPRLRNATPVVLNRTLGGQPFLAANPYQSGCDSRGRSIPSTHWRTPLCLWPLNAARTGVEPPVCILDAKAAFGPPRRLADDRLRCDNVWMVDHPIGAVCRLADGRWHALLCFRVTDMAVNIGGASEAEPAGTWVEEVSVAGEPTVPVWNFA